MDLGPEMMEDDSIHTTHHHHQLTRHEALGHDTQLLRQEALGPDGQIMRQEALGPDGQLLRQESMGPDHQLLRQEVITGKQLSKQRIYFCAKTYKLKQKKNIVFANCVLKFINFHFRWQHQ